MRAQDATRLQPDHPNHLTALTLVKALLDLNADVNKPFSGALHSTSMCCNTTINSSPFYRAATAADVEILKLLLAHGAKLEWSPAEIKPKDGKKVGPASNANVGKTPLMAAIKGGMGAPVQGGPGYTRTGPPPFREPGSREPLQALQVLIAAGADPNARAADGSTPLHQAVQERQVALIRALASAGGSLSAVNKDNLSPLAAAVKLKDTPEVLSVMGDPGAYHRKRDSHEEVIAALRELMHLGPNDPVPPPPPAPVTRKGGDDKEQKITADATARTSAQ
jgi:ankyrin repeat protein